MKLKCHRSNVMPSTIWFFIATINHFQLWVISEAKKILGSVAYTAFDNAHKGNLKLKICISHPLWEKGLGVVVRIPEWKIGKRITSSCSINISPTDF